MDSSSDAPVTGQQQRQLLLVAGSGRSGTSLFTGLTGHLGFYVPKPEVSWNKSNPRGFSEPRWAVDFHNRVLKQANVTVEDGRPEAWEATEEIGRRPEIVAELTAWLEQQFAESDRIVVKDPRVGWFFDLYRQVAGDIGADLRVATMLRDPAEVLRSREVAYGTRTSNSTRATGWINMMLGIERRTRDLPRATLFYPDLLTDWRAAFAAADQGLGLDLIGKATPEQLKAADDLVDPSLRRSLTDWDEMGLHRNIRALTAKVYDAYGRLVGVAPADQGPIRAELDALYEEFKDLYDEAYEVARNRMGATIRREKRQTAARVRRETLESMEVTRPAEQFKERAKDGVRKLVRKARELREERS